MPRARRRVKRRRGGGFAPTVQLYLNTGQIELQPGDNPWIEFSLLTRAADQARRCWVRGDDAGALRHLGQCPGRSGWWGLL